jgi:hypothetical protein
MVSIDNSEQLQFRQKDRELDQSAAGGNEAFQAFDLLKQGRFLDAGKTSSNHVPELILTDNSAKAAGQAKEKYDQKDQQGKMVTEGESSDKKPEENKEHKKESAGDGLKHFGQGLLSGIVLEPINGLTQLANHTLGTNIGEIHFGNQKEVDESAAGKAGKSTGKAAENAAVGAVTKGTATKLGLNGKKAVAFDAVLAGSIDGGILTPVNDKNGDFWSSRMNNAVSGAATSFVYDMGDNLLSRKTAEKLPNAATKAV